MFDKLEVVEARYEELTKMIKYQNAYNASSRFINVVNEMIEHLVTQLGA